MMVSRLPLTTVGSTIMPTDTKKMPENKFLTGSSKTLVRLVYTVPESSVPIKNAPSAELNPMCEASTTMLRQRPSETVSSISSLKYLRVFLKKLGKK